MTGRVPAMLIAGTLCDEAVFAPMLAHLDVEAHHAPPIAEIRDWLGEAVPCC